MKLKKEKVNNNVYYMDGPNPVFKFYYQDKNKTAGLEMAGGLTLFEIKGVNKKAARKLVRGTIGTVVGQDYSTLIQ